MALIHFLTHTIWNRQGLGGKLGWGALVPFALGFSALIRGRNMLYDLGLLPSERLPVHIISVGNLTVGGTGKTPFVLWLARALQARQHSVGIVCRGYKGRRSGITTVGINGHPQATPVEGGDEAVMLARAFSGVVLAGRDRVQAARLAHKNFGLNVLILDDGFQHRRLGRSLDLVLIHARQGIGNGWLLPAGPLREPLSAIRRTDIVILTKGQNIQDKNFQDQELQELQNPPISFDTHKKPCFSADLHPTALIQPERGKWQTLPILHLSGKKVMLVSGVADPSLFHRFVRETEATIIDVREFPDHHVYTQRDLQTIASASQKCDLIVTTEKDLVKIPESFIQQFIFYVIKIVLVFENDPKLINLIKPVFPPSPQRH